MYFSRTIYTTSILKNVPKWYVYYETSINSNNFFLHWYMCLQIIYDNDIKYPTAWSFQLFIHFFIVNI